MSVLFSCYQEQTASKSTVYEQEFYEVLNDLIRIKLLNTSVIQAETRPVTKTMWKEIAGPWETYSSGKETIFATMGTRGLLTGNRLDSAEIRYMYTSIDSTKIMRINSDKVVVPLIPTQELNELFNENNRKDGYEVLKQIYGSSCFITTSSPLFNSNYTKVILWIEYQCGGKQGRGHVFILEKRKGLWWLIEDIGTWES